MGRGASEYDPPVPSMPLGELRFATVEEVADLIRVSRTTVYRLIREGALPAIRVGRGYRVREESVRRYLDDRFDETG